MYTKPSRHSIEYEERKKKKATPDNIKLVRETLVDLAKDDWVIEAQPITQ